jgi:hypothetical protein
MLLVLDQRTGVRDQVKVSVAYLARDVCALSVV